jgi:hypothetical protein
MNLQCVTPSNFLGKNVEVSVISVSRSVVIKNSIQLNFVSDLKLNLRLNYLNFQF